ncbi:hypothetical protein DdX_21214 [Ditylenchus destructor]|uniref:Uncharacterized protein n=1 Tax=Ditylenchus destructor TaxID=166010 RepID=A0AAD4QVR3_9BILA|nr:hypothetical protein DdX_21214 [Ditylenchus destructor]
MKFSVSFAIVFVSVLIAQSFAAPKEGLFKAATRTVVNNTKGVMEDTLNGVKDLTRAASLLPSCLTEEKLPKEATLTRTKCLIISHNNDDTLLSMYFGTDKEEIGYRWIAKYQPKKDGPVYKGKVKRDILSKHELRYKHELHVTLNGVKYWVDKSLVELSDFRKD